MATKKASKSTLKSADEKAQKPTTVTVDELVGTAKKNSSAKKKEDKPEAVKEAVIEINTPQVDLNTSVPDVPDLKINDSESNSDIKSQEGDSPSVSTENHSSSVSRIHIGGSDEAQNQSYSRPPQRFGGGNRFGRYNNQQGYNRDRRNSYSNSTPTQDGPTETVKGFLDVQPEGHGFLRPKFIHSSRDIYISQSQIRRFLLRAGDLIEGLARPPKDTERYFGLLKVESVNGVPADESTQRPHFDDLTAIYPDKQLKLSTGKTPMSTRIIDLVAPIGFGQRGMIVSPPKAGKTTILKDIAAGISENFPDAHLMAALIGERPEEVTDISMSVKGEVIASNFDEPPENQTRVAEITLNRAKRMVESGKDVIILLDSITRLARAYNLVVDPSGRTLSGGFDPAALWPAKKFFGAARNCKEGGSLTIIGTALVETGSRMDDLIYEEFKGTGNMELHLVRALAERRVFPAISIERSGTRGEEKILSEEKLKKIVTMRRMMDMLDSNERTERLVEQLTKTDDNDKFLEILGKS